MAAAAMTCRLCTSEMSLRTLGPLTGEDGPVQVKIKELPALECSKGHRRFATPSFPIDLLNSLAGNLKGQIPTATASGFLVKHYHCSCGKELAGSGRSASFPVEISLKDVPAVRLEVTVQTFKCEGCGKDQVRSVGKVLEKVPAAMAYAFQDAALRPS